MQNHELQMTYRVTNVTVRRKSVRATLQSLLDRASASLSEPPQYSDDREIHHHEHSF